MLAPLSARRAHVVMHITVFLWGFTAILGRSISISALPLVFYRLWGVVLVMGAVVLFRKNPWPAPKRILTFAAVGVLVALHWWLFYACIKLAGVAVAVLCLSSITFFTALFEPIVFGRPVRAYEVVLGTLVIGGVVLLVQLEHRGDARAWAIGLGSALFSAGFGALNGKLASWEDPASLTLFEMFGAALAITAVLAFVPQDFVMPSMLGLRDVALLFVLVVACTVFPWLFSLQVLRTFRPYTLAIAVALKPYIRWAWRSSCGPTPSGSRCGFTWGRRCSSASLR